jgi:polysaccharide export outer membrane protein
MTRAHGQLGVALSAGVVLVAACSRVGQYVWVDAYAEHQQVASSAYVISPGDLINIRVWNQDAMSARVRVRGDGMISLPFLNDVEAAGMEPTALARRMQAKLKEFIVNPVVTVALEEPVPLEISVLGEVTKPGVYKLDQDAGVLNALAGASGLTQYANRDRIFVLRRTRATGDALAPIRIRFTYQALSQAEGAAAKFRLRRGDLVVVE